MIDEIKGGQFGVRFKRRGKEDDHIAIQIISEDDDNWFDHGSTFSSFWLNDLIAVLDAAKGALESQGHKEDFGYRFTPPKENPNEP